MTNTIGEIESAAKTREEICPRHGKYTSRLENPDSDFQWWTRCPACEQECEARAQQEEQEQKQREIRRRFERAAIPLRFRNKHLSAYQAENEGQKTALRTAHRYVEEFDKNRAAGRCLIFLGGVGTGKTMLGCGIAQELVLKGYSVKYTTVANLIRSLRDTWRKQAEYSEIDVMSQWRRLDLLVLDEVGIQYGSEAEVVQLDEMIDARYQAMKPTLVISNCDRAGLEKYLGVRAVDRLRDNGGVMVVSDWPSWRGRIPATEQQAKVSDKAAAGVD